MMLVKLESLSTSELRNLAEQEGIEGVETLDRENLIYVLSEKYEEEENPTLGDQDSSDEVSTKFVNSFSDYKNVSDSVSELPGVEELPEVYEETSIHLLTKNSDWGYVFWSISTLDKEKLEEKKGEVLLSVRMEMEGGNSDSYDILISEDDNEWNIGFSTAATACTVNLVVDYPNGKREKLAVSNTVQLGSSYWLRHKDEMKENDELFKVYLSLLSTKTGEIISNATVREILSSYREEDEE